MWLAALVGAAWACGPSFPDTLLEDRAAALLGLREGTFRWEAVHLVPAPAVPLPAEDAGPRSEHEALGLTGAQVSAMLAARGAASADAAYTIGAGLPEDVRLYTGGAVAFHQGAWDEAAGWFHRVVALPAEARALRGPWARFTLGRMGDPSQFEALRDEVAAGAADPDGLAVASFGEQARLSLSDDLPAAVRLYAEQAAHGSSSGATSLQIVAAALLGVAHPAEPVLDAPEVLPVDDPLVQRLLVAYAWSRVATGSPAVERLLGAIEAAGLDRVDGADRLAALAYDAGRYELAERAAARAPTALGAWVRAKLALRRGDLAGAAAEYAAAAEAFPTDPTAPDGEQQLHTERGLLDLARGEYTQALRAMVAGVGAPDGWMDPGDLGWRAGWLEAAYVAERVLTVDELVDFVGAPDAIPEDLRPAMRALVARRLVREGRPTEAVAWFDDPELRSVAAAYADALSRAQRGDRFDRARGWLDAAVLARPGLRLLGTEGAPDWVMYDGVYGRWVEPAEAPHLLSDAEQARVAAAAPRPGVPRFHYRDVAADHAEAAAALLPPRSQAFAAALCWAAKHVEHHDEDRRQAIYARYLREGPLYDGSGAFGSDCPAPDLDRARAQAAAARWVTIRRASRWSALLGAVGLVGVAFAGWARRRATS